MKEKSSIRFSRKYTFSVLLIVLSLLISMGASISGTNASNNLADSSPNFGTNQPINTHANGSSAGLLSILAVGNGKATTAVRLALDGRRISYASSSALSVGQALSYQLVLLDSSGAFSTTDLSSILAHHTAIAVLGGNRLSALSPILLNNALTFPSTSASKQSGSVTLPSDVTAYAVLFHPQNFAGNRYPTSTFVYQGSFQPDAIVKYLISWLSSVRNTPNTPPSSPHDPLPSFSPSAPTFIGNTKWIVGSVSDSCGATAGQQQVMMDYWYTTTSNSYGTEYWILSYAQHTAEGFSGSGQCYVWVPTSDTEFLDGYTRNAQGQQLVSWDPSGSGSGNPVQYSIGVGPSGPTAGVTFQDNGVSVSYSVSGDPNAGTLTWSNGFGGNFNPSQSNVLLYTLPSAILELNPQFPGGVLPFDDQNTFTATFCAQNYLGGCSAVPYISAQQISFAEAIYTDHINYPGPTTIEIYTYPTNDVYCRSVGLAIDRTLPSPWWPPYQSGYEISSSQCSAFTYYTYPNLLTGSHYVQTAVSGSVPNYKWHTIVYVNGGYVTEGDVGRNQILQANFNV